MLGIAGQVFVWVCGCVGVWVCGRGCPLKKKMLGIAGQGLPGFKVTAAGSLQPDPLAVRQMKGKNFQNVRSIVNFYRKYTGALTFEKKIAKS